MKIRDISDIHIDISDHNYPYNEDTLSSFSCDQGRGYCCQGPCDVHGVVLSANVAAYKSTPFMIGKILVLTGHGVHGG